jgi:hypothetical protein
MGQIGDVGTNLVCVLSRASGKRVLDGSPVGSMFHPMSGLREELGDQRNGSGGGRGQK